MSTLPDKIRRGEQIALPVALLLQAATPVQRIGMWLRLRQAREQVPARVVSYGNITAGGTGKTPAVIARVQLELAAGHRVAVVTRGYGSHKTAEPFVVLPGDGSQDLWEQVGDEPALIRRRAPGVVLVKSADRVAGALAAVERADCDVVILDDGFQSVALVRNEDWVCIDATNPFGNGHILPRGILREPLGALHRASGLIVTRCDQAQDVPALLKRLHELRKGIPIRTTRHAPTGLWRVRDGAFLPLSHLAGTAIGAASAIAQPELFHRTLASLGAHIVAKASYPDHAAIPMEALPKADLVVVTEKDAVRMRDAPEQVYALQIDLEDMVIGSTGTRDA
jgi:tetraacyldisaccharide 4'-kinase